MAFACKSCGREVPDDPEPGTPCPTCGAELVPEKPLEVDPVWAAEKAQKQAVAAAEAPRAKSKAGRWILTLTSIAMVVVAVMMMMQRAPSVKGTADISNDGVMITVTGPKAGIPVKIDGAKAGTTPLVIKLKGARTRPMKIQGNGVTKEIVPDRDQVVMLAPGT